LTLLKLHFVVTRRYIEDGAILTAKLGEGASALFQQLDAALDLLERSGWGPALPIRQIGGNKFAYQFCPEARITFKIKDQIPPRQPPQEMWLQMLTFELTGRD
jgi:hypothetical protein